MFESIRNVFNDILIAVLTARDDELRMVGHFFFRYTLFDGFPNSTTELYEIEKWPLND